MRDAFYPLLADPGPESWRGICELLDDQSVSDAQLTCDLSELARELRAWPAEVERPAPRHWVRESHVASLRLCREVREVDLYRLYCDAAATSPLLRLRCGAPAVRLQRSFSGSLQGAHGRMHQIGVPGQGDLCGSLCVEWRAWTLESADEARLNATCPPCGAVARAIMHAIPGSIACVQHGGGLRRVSVALEVEVKRVAGRQSPTQVQREGALRRRGEIYLLVRRCDEMVRLLCAERDRLLALVG